MTIAYWCVFVAAMMPYLWTVLSKSAGVDNHNPRADEAKRTGWRQRATWAQYNTWEAFAPFAAAVIIAHIRGVDQASIDMWAGIFIGLRILYGVMYIADLALLRSLVWFGGLVCVVALFVI